MVSALVAFAINSNDNVRVTMLGHGPKDDVLVRKLSFVWQVWPEGDDVVSGASLSINGKKQKATYSKIARALEYSPQTPLPVGEHKISAQVVVNGWAKFNKDWVVRVLPEAYTELPPPSTEAVEAIETLNAMRQATGLEAALTDERLCAAAAGHAKYLSTHGLISHSQSPGQAGFLGSEPADRLSRMGFGKGSWEVLAPSVSDAETGIKRLFDAPYHRISMLNPGAVEVGAGWANGNVVMDGAATSEVRTVVSPGDMQRDVQPFWKDNEVPNPFRLHGMSSAMVGYPVTFVRFGSERIKIARFVLADATGKSLACYENFPGVDEHLTNAAFIMPKQKLAPGETYTATVSAKDSRGTDISKTWSFTTASDVSAGARMIASPQGALGSFLAQLAPPRRRL